MLRSLSLYFLSLVALAGAVAAQNGNLATNGQFDHGQGIAGWQVVSPAYSSLSFVPGTDAGGCVASGAALGISDPDSDFGTADYRICVPGLAAGAAYRIAGSFRFDSDLVAGRANVTLSFFTGTDCTGSSPGSTFAGYALTGTSGWQTVASGPHLAPAGTQSALLRALLTQEFGAQPAIEVLFDDIRVASAAWLFGDGFEVGARCRWSAGNP